MLTRPYRSCNIIYIYKYNQSIKVERLGGHEGLEDSSTLDSSNSESESEKASGTRAREQRIKVGGVRGTESVMIT